VRIIIPRLLFLDDDLKKSSQYLTQFHLEHMIRNSCQILMCCLYYILGFRSKNRFKYYFSKDRWDETRFKYIPNYPFKNIPKYTFYTSEESKWCRKCSNHYRYILKYLGFMLEEFAWRNGKEHELSEMHPFLHSAPMEIAVRFGIVLPKLKDKTKMQLPWKNIPLKFRKKDIIAGYRAYYKDIIGNLLFAFIGTKRDVPEFLYENDVLSETV